jgi:pyridoxamine 5'-phosphate oxidase
LVHLADSLVTRATPAAQAWVRLVTVSDPGTNVERGRHAPDRAGRTSGAGGRLADLRQVYRQGALSESDLAGTWWEQFGRWLADAVESQLLVEPNAMVLATADPDGRPSARTVLLKDYDRRGFVFYTNYRSGKGRELAANPRAALVFAWVPMERQVIVGGAAERVGREDTSGYFATRPYGSQLAAWASPQSEVLPSRQPLDDAVAEAAARWPVGTTVPPPAHWGGFRVVPEAVEFWQGRPDRLHDRLRYRRTADGGWVVERLAP